MIPKIIHLCWLSGDEFPPLIKDCIDSMYKNLPDYEIKIWTKENFDIYSVIWVKQAFESKKYAFAADYIRFWALYNYGGIYLDSDVEVLKSFDDFLNCESFIGFEYLNIPEAAVVGCEKGCKWIKDCLDWYNDQPFVSKSGKLRQDVVPLLVKIILDRNYKKRIVDNGKIQKLSGINLYPFHYFSPKNYFNGKIKVHKDTVCIHRFASAWGPNEKRRWTLVVHNTIICLLGKKLHDRLFRFVKPLPLKFNGEKL